nr:tetratricopeptide repeat protein [Phycisphaerales bacterium]
LAAGVVCWATLTVAYGAGRWSAYSQIETRADPQPRPVPTLSPIQQEMEAISGMSEMGCERLLQAAEVALKGYEGRRLGWDRLLSQVASHASMIGCEADMIGWFTTLTRDSEDPSTRALAYLWMGVLGEGALKDDREELLRRYDAALAALDEAGDRGKVSEIRVGALNRKANTLSRLGRFDEAVAVHARAMEAARAITGGNTGRDLGLMINQARLASQAGNPKAACDLLDHVILYSTPTTRREIDWHLSTVVSRYKTGQRTDDPHGGIPALEAAWANPAFRVTHEIARVGYELAQARGRIPGMSRSECDLLVEVIELINDRRAEWVSEAETAHWRKRINDALNSVQISCVSHLQSVTLHGSREYLDLAYRTLLDLRPDPTEQEMFVRQWASDVRQLEEYLSTR